jgi:hypothetical protein
MHGNDAAAHARGQYELEDPIKRLLDGSAASPSGSPANSALELPEDPLAGLSPEPIEVNHTPSSYPPITDPPVRRNQSDLPPLTEAKLALEPPPTRHLHMRQPGKTL